MKFPQEIKGLFTDDKSINYFNQHFQWKVRITPIQRLHPNFKFHYKELK